MKEKYPSKFPILKLPQGEMIILTRRVFNQDDNEFIYYLVCRSINQSQFYGLALDDNDKILVFRPVRNLLDFNFEELRTTALLTNRKAVRLDAERVGKSKLVITFKRAGTFKIKTSEERI